MNTEPERSTPATQAAKTPQMVRVGVWILWASLIILLLPMLGPISAILVQAIYEAQNMPIPQWVEFLVWFPIIFVLTTPLAIVGAILGGVLIFLGRRSKAQA